MIWRESMPARVALATAGLLTLLLAVVVGAAYFVTAYMLRQAVDGALESAVTAVAAGRADLRDEVERYLDDHGDDDDDDAFVRRSLSVLDGSGQLQFGPADQPVDPAAVAAAKLNGRAYASLVRHGGRWQPRSEPAWWQLLTPRPEELRVLYARTGSGSDPLILQMAAPLGEASAVLPALLRWLAALAAIALLLSLAVVWRMAAGTYRPLRAIIATAEDVSTRSLTVRIPDAWTDRTLRQLVRVLNAMIGRLQAAFEAQTRFVAAGAHELRSPLAAMRAELEVALRRRRSPEEYQAALEGALAETERLSALAEHLLVLTRYDRGTAVNPERDIPLAALLERVAGEVMHSAGGEVTVSANPTLLVDGDPIALERALANLARNGIAAGGAPVAMEATPGVGGVWLHVRDQGRGMSREVLPHIFEPFYRADPARGRDGGAGLGLAIVRAVVEAHGGRIEVESEPGRGTAFHLWLPRRQYPSG